MTQFAGIAVPSHLCYNQPLQFSTTTKRIASASFEGETPMTQRVDQAIIAGLQEFDSATVFNALVKKFGLPNAIFL